MSLFNQVKPANACAPLRRAFAALLLAAVGLLEAGCGDVYRPVANPIVGNSPNPAPVHFVFALSANGNDVLSSGTCQPSGTPPPCVSAPGSISRIDVSGDSVGGVVSAGIFPTFAAMTPDNTKYYVVSSDGTVSTGAATSNAQAITVNLPQLCDAGGCAPSAPVFVHSTENGRMYIADSGNGTVSVVDSSTNVVIQTIAVDPAFTGSPLPAPDRNSHPVALAELPNGSKIYAADSGTNRVTSINTTDGSIAAVIPITTGSPIWIVASADNIHVYVLDSSGTVSVISALSDTVTTHSASAGAGANFMHYEAVSNLLYVTNPTASSLSIFDASQDPPALRTGNSIPILPAAGSGCSSGVKPTSVTVLGDETRAYVAAYQIDPSGLVCTQASVVSPATNSVTKTIALSQSGSAPQSQCSSVPFRVFTVASPGSSAGLARVYVSQCDAGAIAVIDTFADNTSPDPHPADVVMSEVPAPVSAFSGSQIAISSVTATPATSTAPATATYSYSLLNGAPLQPDTVANIAGMANAGNNGTFFITSATSSTFTVLSPSGVSAASQTGTGSAVPAQNPVFLVAGQ